MNPKLKNKKLYKKKDTSVYVTATYYQAVREQTNANYNITADGSRIRKPSKHKWIAISRDLKKLFKFGDTVHITGTGVHDGKWVVKDIMNSRFKNKIDFLLPKNYNGIGRWDSVLINKP